jgi:hypothetical protein
MQQTEEMEMDLIGKVLDQALEAGLELEVIYWALIAMKKNPELTPAQAMVLGVTEWIK